MKIPKKIVFLGFVLQLIWTDKNDKEQVKTWTKPTGKNPCVLACNSVGKNLFLIPWKKAKEVDLPHGSLNEKKRFESWSGFLADTAFTIESSKNNLKICGEPLSIIYVSDKWSGEAEQYKHDFKRGNQLFNNNIKKPVTWGFKNKSGKRLVSKRGIIN